MSAWRTSGHLDGPHEDVVDGGLRELREETGVVAGRADVRAALTVHHRAPAGGARAGVLLTVLDWQGEPEITEPHRCDALDWFGWESLPEPMVAYCRAGLDAYRAGAHLAVHFQQPGGPIAYDPAVDRLHIVTDAPLPNNAQAPQEAVRDSAEQAVGRIHDWADASWARENSRVWRASGRSGGIWYVKIHQSDRFHGREVNAYRSWTHALGAHAPRLVAAKASLRVIVVTALPGRSLHGAVLDRAREVRVHRVLGELAAAFHHSARPARPPPTGPHPPGSWNDTWPSHVRT
ncbi:NUDIX domain-containing protein [Streptomyces avermitilis]|uniref:NUDIX domain-containing protein n=1 Tax=Streptomyces avermitilis TaxID=33903 RepID=UPI0033E73724